MRNKGVITVTKQEIEETSEDDFARAIQQTLKKAFEDFFKDCQEKEIIND